jgi:prolipoprotein diacylglyceryltransferase
MTEILQLSIPCTLVAAYLYWGIKTLPRERWQFLAAVPVMKLPDGKWVGVNLTWYGLLTANAYAVAIAVLFFLMGSLDVPLTGTALLAAAMLAVCVPASRLVARIVEKKAHTFTVGGAVFVGILVAPWLVIIMNSVVQGFMIPPAAALAGFAVAYAFGEGLGRLACISFGCCYGKPLREAGPWLCRLFAEHNFVFTGKTRKIAYADGLDGERVVPVQALTACIYTLCGLCSSLLFMNGRFALAFLLSMAVTQGWRVFSETLRADYRGLGGISAYQIMGLLGIVYGSAVPFLAPAAPPRLPDMGSGIAALLHPGAILFIQAVWLIIFLYTGRSTVTGAMLSFHVRRERI